ncbi:MAG: FHA domain-containing protein [Clostridia bacterium]|nr:FHA domain-containing protein [Clostridia bacterium]
MSEMCYRCMTETLENGTCTRCGKPRYVPEPSNADALPVGTRLDNGSPVVGAILGRGGFGITYVALDTEVNPPQKIALKEYMPRHMATRSGLNLQVDPAHQEEYEHSLRAFARESSVIDRLKEHPNIVKVFYSFRENNTAYYGMQFLEGMSLKEWIKKSGKPMSGKEACMLLNPIMDALAYTHKQGLLHRDISPNNIFLCGTGQKDVTAMTPKLIDFGAAHAYVGDYTKSLALIKTKGFTPVEQILYGAECQGSWTDVYAFCAVFYYAITGRNLPDSKDRYIDNATFLTPNELGAKIPKEAENALLSGLAINYKERTQNMAELQEKLCKAFGIAPYHYTKMVESTPVDPDPGPAPVHTPVPRPVEAPVQHEAPAAVKSADTRMRDRILGGMLELIICYAAAFLLVPGWQALLYGLAGMTLLNTVLCSVGGGGTLGMRLSRQRLVDQSGRVPSVAVSLAYSLLTAFFPFSVLDCLVNSGDKPCWREKMLAVQTVSSGEKAPEAPAAAAQKKPVGKAWLETAAGERIDVENGTLVTRHGKDCKGYKHTIILKDEMVSGKHCEFYQARGGWYVQDLYSTNHTYINGSAIPPAAEVPLSDGTRVTIGGTDMTFHC